MLQMHPEVIKYRKFRGQTLVREEEEVVEGRDGEHSEKWQWKGRHSLCQVWSVRLRSPYPTAIGSHGRIDTRE